MRQWTILRRVVFPPQTAWEVSRTTLPKWENHPKMFSAIDNHLCFQSGKTTVTNWRPKPSLDVACVIDLHQVKICLAKEALLW